MANGDDDKLSTSIPEATPDAKRTVYGYKGDATPDWNSEHHIGDHNNTIVASPEHQDVALTHSERLAVFGYERIDPDTGNAYSTGKPFYYKGQLVYDNDTAPEGDRRVDFFDPSHPPDKLSLSSGHYPEKRERPLELNDTDRQYPSVQEEEPAELEEPEHQAGKPSDSILSPQNMVKAIRKAYPSDYGHYNDTQLYDAFKTKFPTGIAQIKAAYPEYAKVPENALLTAIKKKYFPDISNDEFMDRMNPPTGIGGLIHSISEQLPSIIPSWYEHAANVAKFPDQAIDLMNRVVQALGMKTEDPDAKVIGPGGVPISVKPAIPESGPRGQPHIAGELYRWAQREAQRGGKWEEQHRVPPPHDLAGQITQKVAQATGAAPEAMMSFAPGSPAGFSLMAGMIYDAVQGEGKAREKGLDNAMWFGAEGLSYRALEQWFLHTPRGRLLSGFLWGAGSVADQEAKNLLEGKNSTLNDLISTAATSALFGGIFSAGLPKVYGAEGSWSPAMESMNKAMEARASGDLKTAAQLMDQTMSLAGDEARKAATNNVLAFRNKAIPANPGESPAEGPNQRTGTTVSEPEDIEPSQMMEIPGPQQQEGRPSFEERSAARKAKSAAKEQAKYQAAATAPKTGYYPNIEFLGRSSEAPPIESDEIPEVLKNRPELHEQWKSMDPQARGTYLNDLYNSDGTRFKLAQQANPIETVTDQFYYSGIDFGQLGKAIKTTARAIKESRFYKGARDIFAPEHATKAREEAGGIIGEQIARMQERYTRLAEQFWKSQDLGPYRFAYDAYRRRSFWESYPEATRKTWFENWTTGHSSGNPVADFMWQKHLELMDYIGKIDEAWGFSHNYKDNYIQMLVSDAPEKGPEIEARLKKNGFSDPTFMHPSHVPDIATLHKMGLELKTYNLEDADQVRIYQTMLAQARASVLENLRDARRAFTTADLENKDTELVLGLQKARQYLTPEQFNKRFDEIADQIRAQSGKQVWRSPRLKKGEEKHETYWVHKDAEFMMSRSLQPLQWWDPVKKGVDALSWLKQNTMLFNLAWSLFHPNHEGLMSSIDAIAQEWDKAVEQGLDAQGVMKSIGNALTLGYARKFEAMKFAPELRKWMTVKDGGLKLKDLPPWEQELHKHMMEGGFNPYANHERQIQVGHTIAFQRMHQIPREAGAKMDSALNFGMDLLGWRPLQRWYFGDVIPSLKTLSYAQRAAKLFSDRPNLLRPEFGLQRKIELRKIAQFVDSLYGEKNLRESFTHGYVKAIGQATMLSYGWTNAFLDQYGGGIHDLASVDAHWKYLQDRAKIEGSKPPRGRYASNRAHAFVVMQVMSGVYNAAIAAFIGTGVHSLLDLFWPNTGPQDPKTGKTPRVKPAYWSTTEVGGLWKDIEQNGGNPLVGTTEFFMNKAQPQLASIYQAAVNKDYFGNQIAPDMDFVWNPHKGTLDNVMLLNQKLIIDQFWTRAQFLAKQMSPFSVQGAMQPNKRPQDAVASILGFPPAAAYVERSGAQNEIMRLYTEFHAPKGRSALTSAKEHAKEAYRQAIQNNDAHGEEQAIEQMRELGATPEQIEKTTENIQKTKDVPGPYRLWKQLTGPEQVQVIHMAEGEEKELLIKQAKEEVKKALMQAP